MSPANEGSFGVRQRGASARYSNHLSLSHSIEGEHGEPTTTPHLTSTNKLPRHDRKRKYYFFRKRIFNVMTCATASGILVCGTFVTRVWNLRRHRGASTTIQSTFGYLPVKHASDILLQPYQQQIHETDAIEWPWEDDLHIDEEEPDYGGLEMGFLVNDEDKRIIYRQSGMGRGYPVATHSKTYWYYAFDDDVAHNPELWWNPDVQQFDDDQIQQPRSCRRVAWFRDIHPDCNTMHEIDPAGNLQRGTLTLLGDGSFRIVFRADPDLGQPYVFKTYQWNSAGGGEETFSEEDYEYMRMDALVSEKFSADPWFVDMYGFCGVAMLSEIMPYKDLEHYALPTFNRKEKTIDEYNDEETLHMNQLAPDEKLEVALQMAKALSHLHNYKGGRIVHGDLWIAQFLPTTNWTHGVPLGGEQILKFNDFNRAEAMLWDEEHQEYCKYERGQGGGDWRSPEEFSSNPLDEKVDIFAMGINIFTLVTGYYIFPELGSSQEVRQKLREGYVPAFDERLLKRSFAERKLAEIAMLCFEFNPKKRISADELLHLLREAKAENEQLKRKIKKRGKFP